MKIRIVKPEFYTPAGNVVYTSKETVEIDIDDFVAEYNEYYELALVTSLPLGKKILTPSEYLQEKLK